jgi:hypothetical protein
MIERPKEHAMNKRLTLATAEAIAIASFTVIVAAGQTPQAPASRLQATGSALQASAQAQRANPEVRSPKPEVRKVWSGPRTPWGDPDLQGTWSTDDMRSVPMQRPEQFAGRAELSDEEFAQRAAAQAKAKQQEANRSTGTAFGFDVGFRAFRQTSIVVEPADGRIPPLTPEAQQRTARVTVQRSTTPASWEDRSFYDRCITRGVLGSALPVIYGNGNRIVQTPGYVAITYEMVHDTRIIPLDGRSHLSPKVHQYLGDARGHWEGGTLVVETTNFKGNTTGAGPNGGGTPASEALRLVERFTRVADDRIDYEVTIDDPQTYTRPWRILLPFTTQPGYQILPYECHEGNLAIANILSAARSEDKAVAEALKKGLPPPASSPWQGNEVNGGAPRPPAEAAPQR